jgi:ABC-type multidrug transport system permease subunit
VTGTISTSINSYFDTTEINSTAEFSVRDTVLGTSIPEPVTYEIYFLQTISPTTRSIIQQMVDGVINGIINQNPTEVELNYEVKSAKGQEVNQLTYSAPGYILYGPMTILSFALIVLTSEKKDGIYKRLSSSEVRNYEIILSNILADTLLIFIQLIIGCVILLLFGWNPVIYSLTDAIIGTILAVFLFSFFILALAFALAPVFKDPDTAGGGVWVILIPLMMISGIFVPIEFFGEYMQNIAAFLPTRYAVIIFQNLFLKGLPVTNPSTLLNMGLLLIYSVVIFIIGVFAFKKFK